MLDGCLGRAGRINRLLDLRHDITRTILLQLRQRGLITGQILFGLLSQWNLLGILLEHLA
jgi:hypothetical protein